MRKTIFTILYLLMVFKLSSQVFTDTDFGYAITSTVPAEVMITGRAVSNTDTSIEIPNEVEFQGTKYSVTSIGASAFLGNQLTNVLIPGSVTSIGASAFAKNQLTSIVIPEGVTKIENGVFYNNQLLSVNLPNNIITIGKSSFSNNPLTSIILPSGLKSIDEFAFQKTKLTNITFPNGFISIAYGSFIECELRSVTFPNTLITIGDGAFANNKLLSVAFPNSLKSIGAIAFSNNQLTSLVIPNGDLMDIGTHAFLFNPLTTVISYMEKPLDNSALFTYPDSPEAPIPSIDLTVPCGTKEAYIKAGWDDSHELSGIATITEDCIETDNGFLYKVISTDPAMVSLLGKAPENTDTSISIPNSITFDGITYSVATIGGSAFENNQIEHIELPQSLISIGPTAFVGNKLMNIELPESLKYIGFGAFGLNQLTSVEIPNSVIEIHDLAFAFNQLTSVKIPSSVAIIGGGSFAQNPIESIILEMEIPVNFNSVFVYSDDPNPIIPSVSVRIPCGTTDAYVAAGWQVDTEQGVTEIIEDCVIYEVETNDCITATEVVVSGDQFVNVTVDGAIIAAINPNGNNLGNVTGSVYISTSPTLKRTVYLNPENNIAATVRIYLSSEELNALIAENSTGDNVYSIDNLQMTKVSGDACGVDNENVTTKVIESSAIAVGEDKAGYYLEFDVDGFSSFTASFPARTLPVELVSFDAEAVALGNKLIWETATEINNDYFEVERSQDGQSFETIGRVEGSGTTTFASTYEYLDTDNVLEAYYRLRQVDYDGTVSYSKVIKVVNNERGVGIYPNPVSETLYFTKAMDYMIYNSLGQVILSGIDSQIDVSNFEAGMYLINLGGTVRQFIVK